MGSLVAVAVQAAPSPDPAYQVGPVLPVTGKISGVPVTATAAHPVVQVAEPVVYTSPAVKVAHVATPTIYTASHYKVAPAAHVVHSGYPYATYGTRYLSYSPYYTPYAYAAHAW